MAVTDRILFSDLGAELPPALLDALSARSYELATPVQAAVLAPAAHGRDLLVSSQTGSGKTIAFGAALTATLLDAASSDSPVARVAGAPRALVIVPTRELAAQVREELGWLLAGTSLRLGAFTGGTAVSGDLRALHRGVDVAIGTPGRLVDLMRREKLALGKLEVVVLDEADQMLDLGFREDLETLLGAAPVERRTLLLSATLPSEIRALARRFQRDALAIDPRHAAASSGGAARPAAGAHDDITYLAHLIAGGDRLAAVVNLLRASPDARAIVFCTRRDGVGTLHRELMVRGFAATAISGERAQTERDRALDQVRQGEARILVATNVAARGLHLPDVDLIIHADLPLNAESLTHRSGRTGRAGRKGTAVVIASLAERRKAERLLSSAQVRVAWTAPPSEKQIAAAARAQLFDNLLAETPRDDSAVEGATEPAAGSTGDLLESFRGKVSVEDLARRLLARELERLPAGERLLPVVLPSARTDAGSVAAAARRRRVSSARRLRARGRALSREPGRQGPGRSALAAAADLPPRRRHPARGRRDPHRPARDDLRDLRRRGRRLRACRRRDRSPRAARARGTRRWRRAGAAPLTTLGHTCQSPKQRGHRLARDITPRSRTPRSLTSRGRSSRSRAPRSRTPKKPHAEKPHAAKPRLAQPKAREAARREAEIRKAPRRRASLHATARRRAGALPAQGPARSASGRQAPRLSAELIMAILVSAQDLEAGFGARPLFGGVSFTIEDGERIGLIGPNGAGKSTLLRILAGAMAPDRGQISRRRGLRVGHLAQVPQLTPGATVEQIVHEGVAEDDWDRLREAQAVMAKLALAGTGSGAGISPSTPVDSLSGGWKKRVALARELSRHPDLLLLDEPTNHLDVASIEWIEGLLAAAPFATITVTHDRLFLQRVATRILELDRRNAGGLLSVAGDYTTYLRVKGGDDARAGAARGRAAQHPAPRDRVAAPRRRRAHHQAAGAHPARRHAGRRRGRAVDAQSAARRHDRLRGTGAASEASHRGTRYRQALRRPHDFSRRRRAAGARACGSGCWAPTVAASRR